MCDRSSTGISTVAKPHFLKVLNNFVLSLVNGDVKRNVLIPILIRCCRGLRNYLRLSKRNQSLASRLDHGSLDAAPSVRGRAVAPPTAASRTDLCNHLKKYRAICPVVE